MSRNLFLVAVSLCITFGSIAIGPVSGPAFSQESAAATPKPTEETKPSEEKKPSEKPSEKSDEKSEVENKPAAEADNTTEDQPFEPPKSDEGAPASEKAEEASKADKASKADEEKQKVKNTKRQGAAVPAAGGGTEPKVLPKMLPKLGVFDGPMLPGQPWRVHDIRRPRPPMVTPGELSTYEKPGTAPSDAIVLFDGKDLSNWCHVSTEDPKQLIEAQWKVEDGYFEVVPRTGHLQTIDSFGSCQLHIEWQSPAVVRGDSQGRGNSGIFFMEAFEVQVLDSFDNRTYADGQAGSLYGQYPPMVNASRKPGEWQVYDILFQAPKFTLDGKLESPASITVMHNGVFLHHARTYYGPSGGGGVPAYRQLSPAAPIKLQDHGNPVRFRNVWVRPLPE